MQFALRQNRPNPFSKTTTIQFDLPRESAVSLRIFDVQGRMIRALAAGGRYGPGTWSLGWDRSTQSGREAPAGVYFYRLNAGEFSEQRKMILLT